VCEREARGHLINVRKPGELIRKEEENSSADDADERRSEERRSREKESSADEDDEEDEGLKQGRQETIMQADFPTLFPSSSSSSSSSADEFSFPLRMSSLPVCG
jgi:hypothetical protein